MSISDSDHKSITHYLFNDMTEQEKAEFEARMASDSELAAEVERQRDMLKEIAARITYKEAMEDPHLGEARELAAKAAGNTGTSPGTQRARYTPRQRALHYLLVAAQVALLVAVGIVLSKEPTSAQLFTRYYAPFSVDQPVVSPVSPAEALLAQGILNYRMGNYSQVIAALSGIEEQEGGEYLPPESTLTLGLAYLAVNDYANAVLIFRQHLDRYDSYKPEARWYLGLSYLRQDNPAAARSILGTLAATGGPLSKKARRLAHKIDRMMERSGR